MKIKNDFYTPVPHPICRLADFLRFLSGLGRHILGLSEVPLEQRLLLLLVRNLLAFVFAFSTFLFMVFFQREKSCTNLRSKNCQYIPYGC